MESQTSKRIKSGNTEKIPEAMSSYRRIVDIVEEVTNERSQRYRSLALFVGAVIAGMSAGTLFGYYALTGRIIPAEEVVQEGFIPPSKLEVVCYDFDLDGKPETAEIIQGKYYWLKEGDGGPILEPVPK